MLVKTIFMFRITDARYVLFMVLGHRASCMDVNGTNNG